MGQGQFGKECSPFARFASGVYLAAVFGYNAVTDAKPQPGAAFFSLGGVKGVEDLFQVFSAVMPGPSSVNVVLIYSFLSSVLMVSFPPLLASVMACSAFRMMFKNTSCI